MSPSEETCMMLVASGKGGLPLGSHSCPSYCIKMLLDWHSGEEAMLHDGHDVGTRPLEGGGAPQLNTLRGCPGGALLNR